MKVTERRTKVDFAICMKELVDIHFADADLIRLVMDNLNTHTIAALYEVFAPDEPRRIAKNLEIHHTPKHGKHIDTKKPSEPALSQPCGLGRPPRETLKEN
nr:transposase [Fischerella sp. PCC 9605]